MVVSLDRQRPQRLLILPALFAEANLLRHQTILIMHCLDKAGIDSFLPDLPGCNESLAPLTEQTLSSWQKAADAAATYFRATDILTIRGGILLAPQHFSGWSYAPVDGPSILRKMIRSRIIGQRETGIAEKREDLMIRGRSEGLELAGYRLGPAMIEQLSRTGTARPGNLIEIPHSQLQEGPLWHRTEPDSNQKEAQSLTDYITKAAGQ
ncbi:hypothetical protein D6851_01775 [Altericroceibacterium spongiae]|uniref:Uncharacterized protein n=2 Tax=Altericroceibacterium spongiae TaxID=2320269 RepID=A0A420ESH6_9SPHN|nr:hypothetical protein D6851_01775 [Altericroceibacterium spongiae]